MSYYAIRHKPTGAYFPTFKGGQRRGSTFIKLPFKGCPRIFPSKVAASNCLRWWLAGESTYEYESDDMGYNSYVVGASPGKGIDETRKAEEMEIVKVEINAIN